MDRVRRKFRRLLRHNPRVRWVFKFALGGWRPVTAGKTAPGAWQKSTGSLPGFFSHKQTPHIMALNRYQFTGNIGQDATVRTLDGGTTAIGFTVAITEKYKDRQGNPQETTTWVSCTRWVQAGGSTAIAQYLKKGTKVLIEGKPTARAYEKQDGTTAASLEVRVDSLELLGAAPQQQGAAAQPQQGQRPQNSIPAGNVGGYSGVPQPQQQAWQNATQWNNLPAGNAGWNPVTADVNDDLPF